MAGCKRAYAEENAENGSDAETVSSKNSLPFRVSLSKTATPEISGKRMVDGTLLLSPSDLLILAGCFT